MLTANLKDNFSSEGAKLDNRGLELGRQVVGDIVDPRGNGFHGLSDDAESAAGVAGVSRFDRCVNREDLRLFGDPPDLPDLRISDFRNVVR